MRFTSVNMLENHVAAFNETVSFKYEKKKTQQKQRRCLVCGRMFRSKSPANRNCGDHDAMKLFGKSAETLGTY